MFLVFIVFLKKQWLKNWLSEVVGLDIGQREVRDVQKDREVDCGKRKSLNCCVNMFQYNDVRDIKNIEEK